jgi:hypothetical protein
MFSTNGKGVIATVTDFVQNNKILIATILAVVVLYLYQFGILIASEGMAGYPNPHFSGGKHLNLVAGDAGWGGPMHSASSYGATRPLGSSAVGAHEQDLLHFGHCQPDPCSPTAVSARASEEVMSMINIGLLEHGDAATEDEYERLIREANYNCSTHF